MLCIKSKDPAISLRLNYRINRQKEYLKERFDDRRPDASIQDNDERESYCTEKGKADHQTTITLEGIKALADFGIAVIFLKDISNSGYIPDNLFTTIYSPA